MPNTVPNDYNPYAGCHKYEELIEELKLHEENAVELLFKNQKLQEQNETLQVMATQGARKGLEKNKDIAKLTEQLNEESQQRLKNKECWMSVQKQYHELKQENNNVIRVLNVVRKDNKQLKEQLDTLDQECASRMNKEQESKQDEIITKLCDMIRGLVPDPHADALIDEAYGENE